MVLIWLGKRPSISSRETVMYANADARDIFRRILVEDAELLAALADGPLPATDDDRVGDD